VSGGENYHHDQDVSDFYNANKAQFNVAEPQYHIAQMW